MIIKDNLPYLILYAIMQFKGKTVSETLLMRLFHKLFTLKNESMVWKENCRGVKYSSTIENELVAMSVNGLLQKTIDYPVGEKAIEIYYSLKNNGKEALKYWEYNNLKSHKALKNLIKDIRNIAKSLQDNTI